MVIKRALTEEHPWLLLNILKALNAANELANQQRLETHRLLSGIRADIAGGL